MLKDFGTLKTELAELASIVNSFKSEAVQLKIVELLFRDQGVVPETPATPPTKRHPSRHKKATPAVTGTESSEAPSAAQKRRKPAAGRPGPKATLDKLVADGFFKNARTIGEIVTHCSETLVLTFKQSDFSGHLGRLTRDGVLKRGKNENGQFQYTQN